jgi:Tol biopolymer transport system component
MQARKLKLVPLGEENIMRKMVLPVSMGVLILFTLACGLPSLANRSSSSPTTLPNPTNPISATLAAHSNLTLDKIALQASDLKTGFAKGEVQTQTDEPGVIRYYFINYSIHKPLIIVINSNFIFKTAEQAGVFYQKEREEAKQVKDSQPLTLPGPLGDEYYAFRGSGNMQSVGIGWRYQNAYIHVSYVGGPALSPDEIVSIVTPIQTRLAGSLDSLSQSSTEQPAETGGLPATTTPAQEAPAVAQNDAGQIVFVSCQSHNSLGMGTQCGISIMSADGSHLRQLTNLEGDIHPSLSPDGTRVAFTSHQRDGNDEIYVINSDGSNLTRLTNNPGENTAPTWSPDGTQIAFMSNLLAPKDPKQIFAYVMGVDGSSPHRLTQSDGFDPRWSSDGSQVVFVTVKNNVSTIHVMNADGTKPLVIKTKPVQDIESTVWSPDGTQIAFLSQKTLTDPIEVDVIGKDGNDQRSLTSGFKPVFGGLSWSPDGQKILFAMHGDGKSLTGDLQLFTVNPDGSGLQRLEAACPYCYDADWGH